MTETVTGPEVSADQFAEHLFASALGTIEMLSVYLGDELGWYDALAASPSTAKQLAAATSTQERYAREWLEQQAVCGILVTDPSAAADDRVYSLTPASREVLTDSTSLAYMAPVARAFASAAVQLPSLLTAYRDGGGVSWDQLGDGMRSAQAAMNRQWFEQELGHSLEGVGDLHRVLSRPGARIADVGFGFGWSTIALARAYPEARLDGFDVDAPSVEAARRNAADAGVADRVTFNLAGGDTLAAAGPFDAVFAFECIHDMPQPVDVLAAMRSAVKPDGAVVVMDEAVAPEFTAPGDELERVMYGFSLLVCLPDGMSSQPSVGTGTVMRPSTLEGYAREAGFSGVDILPIEDFAFFRFYRLRH
jgi:2-polyprenyl-3-methyl-5-hydroxy-6-metoxy-1,4-benzoquinol methylase